MGCHRGTGRAQYRHLAVTCNGTVAIVIMGVLASQITSLTIVYSNVYSGADQRKHQSSASLAFVRGIHRRPVNSPYKWSAMRKMFPFDDVIMTTATRNHTIQIRMNSLSDTLFIIKQEHDYIPSETILPKQNAVITWQHFPHYWPFVRRIGGFTSQRAKNADVYYCLSCCWSKQAARNTVMINQMSPQVRLLSNYISQHSQLHDFIHNNIFWIWPFEGEGLRSKWNCSPSFFWRIPNKFHTWFLELCYVIWWVLASPCENYLPIIIKVASLALRECHQKNPGRYAWNQPP